MWEGEKTSKPLCHHEGEGEKSKPTTEEEEIIPFWGRNEVNAVCVRRVGFKGKPKKVGVGPRGHNSTLFHEGGRGRTCNEFEG